MSGELAQDERTATGSDAMLQAQADHALALRELQAVREIAHAFLVADRPDEVHQYALDRVTPLLGASFSLVLLLDTSSEFMHAVAQHDWPERFADWIGALRIRFGQGPSGVAVSEKRVVEIADLHAEPMLSDWYDVANELGFRSIVAAPLIGSRGPIGAVSFYFADERHVSAEQRDLVRLIADQLAATNEKAQLIAELRRANAALAEANATLEAQASSEGVTQRRQFAFFEHFTRAVMHEALAEAPGDVRLMRLHALAHAAQQAVALESRTLTPVLADFDVRIPLLAAIDAWRAKARPQPITIGEPTVLLPTIRSDEQLVTRALNLALGVAVRAASSVSAGVHAEVELGRGFVAYRLQWSLAESVRSAQDAGRDSLSGIDGALFDPFEALSATVARYDSADFAQELSLTSPLDLPLARSLARLLGGDVQRTTDVSGNLVIDSLSLIFPLDALPDTDAALARLASQHGHRNSESS